MASATLNISYRPARIGFCIRQDDLPAAILAMDLATTIWGGRFSPIIPCDDAKHASRLIDRFRVDALYPVTRDSVIDKVISSCKSQAWPFLEREFYVGDSVGKTPQYVSVTHPIRILRARRDNASQHPTVVKVDWEADDPLAAWFCALIGRYQNNDTSSRFRDDFASLWPKTIKLAKGEDVPADLMHQITPNSVTAIAIDLGRNRQKAVYVASGEEFDDIISFWNLRADGEKVAFYLQPVRDRLERFLSRFRAFDAEIRPAEEPNSICIYAKNKTILDDTEFRGLAFTPVDYVTSSFGSALPRFTTRPRSVLGSVDNNQPPSIDFALPKKPCSENVEFHRQHLVLEVTTFRNVI